MRNVLFVVSGPSGVGKGTIVRAVAEHDPNLWLSVSLTTRKPRRGEVDGEAYYFVTKEEFERRIAAGDLLEYNNHFENYYGTPLPEVERELGRRSVILEIEPVGGLKAAERVRKSGRYPVVLIMIVPPTIEALTARIEKRGKESEQQMRERRERVAFELAQAEKYDYVITNDDLDTAIAEFQRIVAQETDRDGGEL